MLFSFKKIRQKQSAVLHPPQLRIVLLGAVLLTLSGCCSKPKGPTEPKPHAATANTLVVDVGLSAEDRALYYNTAEGSELYPYRFFLALNNLGDTPHTGLFKDHLERYGMVYDDTIQNPRHLPVGMTVQMSKDTRNFNMEMIGVNCAMCHVSEWTYNQKAFRIDGGPSMVNIQLFYSDLLKSTLATLGNLEEAWAFMRRFHATAEESHLPHQSAALAAKSGTKLQLHSHSTVQEMRTKGDFERALAAELQKVHTEEFSFAQRILKDIKKEELKFEEPKVENPNDKVPTLKTPPLPKPQKNIPSLDSHGLPLFKRTSHEADLTSNPSQQNAAQTFPNAHPRNYTQFKTLSPTANLYSESTENSSGEIIASETVTDFQIMLRLLFARVVFFQRLVSRNTGTTPGNGRIDAFGAARNLLFNSDVQTPNAPVSWPHLWEFNKLKWLHYDANTNSITERNIGQALGLGAVFETKTFSSTLDARGLCALEKVAKKMHAPKWPQELGSIDEAKAARGQLSFQKRCISCHQEENLNTSLAAIGTNANRANNFANNVAGVPFPEAIAPLLTQLKTKAFADAKMTAEEIADCEKETPIWRGPRKYASRPLAGIWGSPPYLHNGSVPTLYDLLQPVSARPTVFHVGREYDPVKVGIRTDKKAGHFEYNVSAIGNDARGHTYGTQPESEGGLSEEERMELLEYLKTL